MKHIDSARITDLLQSASKADERQVCDILAKARALKRLSLEETAVLLARKEQKDLDDIFAAAGRVKQNIYGKRVVLFAPIYVNNFCANRCSYCAFKNDNSLMRRRALNQEEIKKETEYLLKRGHKRLLMVSGEAAPLGKKLVDYYVEAIGAIYSASFGSHSIRRVNVNCAPLGLAEFKELKDAGIGTYQLFQETYHDQTYAYVHEQGPKRDADNRIDAIDRAIVAGIDDVGLGVLYGLYDWRWETLALLMHIEHLEKRFGIGPHTISIPRLEPAAGSEFSKMAPYPVSDADFKIIVSVLRLSVPYTGIILSTREAPGLRDELFGLGVSQASAGSNTYPGGYTAASQAGEAGEGQFSTADHRSLEEVMASLIGKYFIPSFCTACYRSQRTGKAFMCLAKPGIIKGKCSMNALITLKEYLDDFASPKLKHDGYKLISKVRQELDSESANELEHFFADIDKGLRDVYV